MNWLERVLDEAGLRYFKRGSEFLLIFRGEALDFPVLLQGGEEFLHAVYVAGRAPAAIDSELAARLLEWNGQHNMVRVAMVEGDLVLAADLPLAGAVPDRSSVEQLLLSVAASAEELMPSLVPSLLGERALDAVPADEAAAEAPPRRAGEGSRAGYPGGTPPAAGSPAGIREVRCLRPRPPPTPKSTGTLRTSDHDHSRSNPYPN